MWKSAKTPALKEVINEKALFNTLIAYSHPHDVAMKCDTEESVIM